MAKSSHYDKDAADYAVAFIENLRHTKGIWAGKPFELIGWQEQFFSRITETFEEIYFFKGTHFHCVKNYSVKIAGNKPTAQHRK